MTSGGQAAQSRSLSAPAGAKAAGFALSVGVASACCSPGGGAMIDACSGSLPGPRINAEPKATSNPSTTTTAIAAASLTLVSSRFSGVRMR